LTSGTIWARAERGAELVVLEGCEQPADDLGPRPERGCTTALVAATPDRGRAAGRRVGDQLLGESALADPRFAAQQDDAATARQDLLQVVVQGSQLAVTAHERQADHDVVVRSFGRADATSRPLRGRLGCRRLDHHGRRQRGIVGQHGSLERLELGPGVHAQLLDQHGTSVLVLPQGLGLTPAPVQRQDELGAEPLAEGMRSHEVDQRRHHLRVPSRVELRVGESFVRGQHELGQPGRGLPGERVVHQACERMPAHQRQRGPVALGRSVLIASARCFATVTNQSLHPERVDVVRLDDQDVARSPPCHHLRAEDAAQLRDLCLQRVRRVRRVLLDPDLVDETVTGHRMRRRQRQHGYQRLQLGARNR
jgi:hypothetical protein